MQKSLNSQNKPTLFQYAYSFLFSIAFVLLFIICVITLNQLDLQYSSSEGSMIMPTGTKLLQLIQ